MNEYGDRFLFWFCHPLDEQRGSGQTHCSERSEVQRAERAKASQSLRKPAVVYLKLRTGRTKNHGYRRLNTTQNTTQTMYIRHTKYLVWEQRTDVRGGEGVREGPWL